MSFSQALSGINAQREQLSAIGNNIANSQTVGFKSSDVLFADVYAASKGLGVQVSDTRQDFTQGSVDSTGRNLDLAIAGDGFYSLERSSGETGYSRNGEFSINADGYMVNAQGDRLMGYGLDKNVDQAEVQSGESLPYPFTDVVVGGDLESIQVPSDDMPAKQTSEAEGLFNLDSRVKPGEDLNTASFNFKDGGGTKQDIDLDYHFSNSYTAYDSLGNPRQVTSYFEKVSDNTWLSTIAVDGEMMNSDGEKFDPSAGGETPQSFLLNFNQNGQLVTKADVVDAGQGPTTGTEFDELADSAVMGVTEVDDAFNFTQASTSDPYKRNSNVLNNGNIANNEGVLDSTADINDLITDGSDVKSTSVQDIDIPGVQGANNPTDLVFEFDFAGTSQFGNDSKQKELSQNGYTSGALVGVDVQEDGTVQRNFANGKSRPAGQIALSTFRNEEGLEPLGNNLWGESPTSGLPNEGPAGSGSYGKIQSGAVESSNVDLSEELVDMIVSQRAYQANSNTISTQDELLQTVINL